MLFARCDEQQRGRMQLRIRPKHIANQCQLPRLPQAPVGPVFVTSCTLARLALRARTGHWRLQPMPLCSQLSGSRCAGPQRTSTRCQQRSRCIHRSQRVRQGLHLRFVHEQPSGSRGLCNGPTRISKRANLRHERSSTCQAAMGSNDPPAQLPGEALSKVQPSPAQLPDVASSQVQHPSAQLPADASSKAPLEQPPLPNQAAQTPQ